MYLIKLIAHVQINNYYYAVQCFEGMKAYRGPDGKVRLFRPMENMNRMKRSAVAASLPVSLPHALLYYIRVYFRGCFHPPPPLEIYLPYIMLEGCPPWICIPHPPPLNICCYVFAPSWAKSWNKPLYIVIPTWFSLSRNHIGHYIT